MRVGLAFFVVSVGVSLCLSAREVRERVTEGGGGESATSWARW